MTKKIKILDQLCYFNKNADDDQNSNLFLAKIDTT